MSISHFAVLIDLLSLATIFILINTTRYVWIFISTSILRRIMSSDSEQDDAELADLATLSVAGLKKELKAVNVTFDKHGALQSELQALWALHKLGHLDASVDPDDDALATTIEWCEMSAGDLTDLLKDKGLATKSNKWKRVQALIEDEYVNSLREDKFRSC